MRNKQNWLAKIWFYVFWAQHFCLLLLLSTQTSRTCWLTNYLTYTLPIWQRPSSGCVLTPLPYTLYTNDCHLIRCTDTVITFADDTAVAADIWRQQVCAQKWGAEAVWSDNNLAPSISKTKEMMTDYIRRRSDTTPPRLCSTSAGTASGRFPPLISRGATSASITAAVKQAHQRRHFLRALRRNHAEEKLLVASCCTTIDSVLTHWIAVWHTSCSAADRKRVQRVINTIQRTIDCPLPSLEAISSSRCLSRAKKIIKDPPHSGQHLFNPLPSGRQCRCTNSRTNRL